MCRNCQGIIKYSGPSWQYIFELFEREMGLDANEQAKGSSGYHCGIEKSEMKDAFVINKIEIPWESACVFNILAWMYLFFVRINCPNQPWDTEVKKYEEDFWIMVQVNSQTSKLSLKTLIRHKQHQTIKSLNSGWEFPNRYSYQEMKYEYLPSFYF